MPGKAFKHIVVTTDFSDLSTAALLFLQSYQAFADGRISLVHVLDVAPVVNMPMVELPSGAVGKQLEEETLREFAEFIRAHVPASIPVDAVIRHGDPAREIIRYAGEIAADLIVIATHGRTGLSHMVMGSVAERVIRSSSVPVLTIKPAAMREGFIHQSDVEEQLHLARQ